MHVDRVWPSFGALASLAPRNQVRGAQLLKLDLSQPVLFGGQMPQHVILIGLGLDRAPRFSAQLAVLLYQLGHRHGRGFGRASLDL